ncbi:hypothetical protein BGZ99_001949 [Dissophora globulifera]|uniref:Uncharacterized protein n=1 Tax=Dissophora globulifera TaxID=979702 RepID=A0A9P6UXS8_9FUNG|nr:hypothetical protein BGZ99_001949 [Dissophora globulifera]
MVVAALHNSVPGPFQMELISDWLITLSQANQVARKRPASPTSPTASVSSASSSQEYLSLSAQTNNQGSSNSDDSEDENEADDYSSLPSFAGGYATPASMLSMPRMPARVSLASKSRRASDLVRDNSLDLAMDRRASAAAAAKPRGWFW